MDGSVRISGRRPEAAGGSGGSGSRMMIEVSRITAPASANAAASGGRRRNGLAIKAKHGDGQRNTAKLRGGKVDDLGHGFSPDNDVRGEEQICGGITETGPPGRGSGPVCAAVYPLPRRCPRTVIGTESGVLPCGRRRYGFGYVFR